jgi:type IV secretory pathway VirB2 component (pilin)
MRQVIEGERQGGFISTVILIIIALGVLLYFGFDVKDWINRAVDWVAHILTILRNMI